MRKGLSEHTSLIQDIARRLLAPYSVSRDRTSPLLLALSVGLAAGIFTLDLSVPSGIGVPVLYIAPVALIELWSSPKESGLVLLIAAGCTAAILLGFFFAPFAEIPLWAAIPNRMIALLVIWVTVVLSLLRKHVEEEVKILRGLLPICSYCKRIRDDQGYWRNLEAYIAAHSDADFTHGLCPDCGARYYPEAFKAPQAETPPSTTQVTPISASRP